MMALSHIYRAITGRWYVKVLVGTTNTSFSFENVYVLLVLAVTYLYYVICSQYFIAFKLVSILTVFGPHGLILWIALVPFEEYYPLHLHCTWIKSTLFIDKGFIVIFIPNFCPNMAEVYGLMRLFLITDDVLVNLDPILQLVNARFIRNKGPLLSYSVIIVNRSFLHLYYV